MVLPLCAPMPNIQNYAQNVCDYSLYDTFYRFSVFFYVLLVIFKLKYSFKCHASSGRTTSIQPTTVHIVVHGPGPSGSPWTRGKQNVPTHISHYYSPKSR